MALSSPPAPCSATSNTHSQLDLPPPAAASTSAGSLSPTSPSLSPSLRIDPSSPQAWQTTALMALPTPSLVFTEAASSSSASMPFDHWSASPTSAQGDGAAGSSSSHSPLSTLPTPQPNQHLFASSFSSSSFSTPMADSSSSFEAPPRGAPPSRSNSVSSTGSRTSSFFASTSPAAALSPPKPLAPPAGAVSLGRAGSVGRASRPADRLGFAARAVNHPRSVSDASLTRPPGGGAGPGFSGGGPDSASPLAPTMSSPARENGNGGMVGLGIGLANKPYCSSERDAAAADGGGLAEGLPSSSSSSVVGAFYASAGGLPSSLPMTPTSSGSSYSSFTTTSDWARLPSHLRLLPSEGATAPLSRRLSRNVTPSPSGLPPLSLDAVPGRRIVTSPTTSSTTPLTRSHINREATQPPPRSVLSSASVVARGDVLVEESGDEDEEEAEKGKGQEEKQETAEDVNMSSVSGLSHHRTGACRRKRQRRWKLVGNEVGSGAFSQVWCARLENPQDDDDEALKEVVAVKIMSKELCVDGRTLTSFTREVAILKKLTHPSIIRHLASFSTPTHHCLVLPFVNGGELFAVVESPKSWGRVGRGWVKRVWGELAEAVGWLHERGVVHRDIKLENILLAHPLPSSTIDPPPPLTASDVLPRPTPLLRLSDFGLAKEFDPANPILTARCGSDSYAAPEIIMGKPYDGRQTDAWACGVVLFALLTRTLPFGSPPTDDPELERRSERRSRMLRIAKGEFAWPTAEAASPSPAPVQAPPAASSTAAPPPPPATMLSTSTPGPTVNNSSSSSSAGAAAGGGSARLIEGDAPAAARARVVVEGLLTREPGRRWSIWGDKVRAWVGEEEAGDWLA